MRRIFIHRFLAFTLFSLCTACYAVDGVTFEFASGNHTQIARLGTQFNWERQWKQTSQTHIGGYWDITLAQWRENRYLDIAHNSRNIFDLAFTPVFNLQRDDGIGFYGEFGIGLHYLSEEYDNNKRQLGSNFQFGSHLATGYTFPTGLDLSMRLEHISNGGLTKPNDGVNFAGVRVGYRF
jgi:lipid A 3-O-deacylase